MANTRTESIKELHRLIIKKINEKDADGALDYYLQASRKQDKQATLEALALLFSKLTSAQIAWLGPRTDKEIDSLHRIHDKFKEKFASLEFKHTDPFHAFCFEFCIQLLNRPEKLKAFIERLDKEKPRTLRYIIRDPLWQAIQRKMGMDSSQLILKELKLESETKATPPKPEDTEQMQAAVTDKPKPPVKVECDQNTDSYLHFALAQVDLRHSA
ncbi:MAG: hypothetical protein ACYCQI_15455 [Gammaproteobacteria bacterium]